MQPDPRDARLAAVRPLLLAILSYALFLTIGLFVSHKPLVPLDEAGLWIVGHASLTAWILTWTLYMLWLAPLGLALIIVAILRPRWRTRIAVSLILLLIMWFAADQLQHIFARPRRLDWVLKHETSFSYPSSHATLAVAFYGFWAYLFSRSSELSPPLRTWIPAMLVVLIGAVCWARLALGAHYPTDILGGVLLGLAGVNLALAVCAAFGETFGPAPA